MQIMTARELAEILRIHPTTVYRLARQGQLPAFKIGSDWRFHSQAVLALLDSIAPIPKRAGAREV